MWVYISEGLLGLSSLSCVCGRAVEYRAQCGGVHMCGRAIEYRAQYGGVHRARLCYVAVCVAHLFFYFIFLSTWVVFGAPIKGVCVCVLSLFTRDP